MAGRRMPHAMAMLIPEAWAKNAHMNPQKRAFYEYHASLMEPWDGPAAIAFTDGRSIGATLDRNGLRPARYLVTHDDLVIMASETGVLPVKPEDVKLKGRLQPGKMLLVDTVEGRIISDKEIKRALYGRNPYQLWLKENQITLDQLPEPPREHGTDRRHPAAAPARLRLHRRRPEDDPRPDGREGRGADRLHGHRYAAGLPLRQAAAAVQLLQAALRAGDQSAHRPDPRRDGDVAHQLHRHRAQHPGRDAAALPHAEAAASHPHQPRSGKAAPRLAGRFPGHHAAHALPGGGGRARGWSARSTQLCRRASLAIQVRLHAADSLRPRPRRRTTRPFPACWR